MPGAEPRSVGSNIGSSALGMLGVTEKAILEIADVTKKKISEEKAQKPSAGAGLGKKLPLDSFDTDLLKHFTMENSSDQSMDAYEAGQKYRFHVQFNPEELYINGYGGEQVPIQDYMPDRNGQPGQPGQPGQQPGQGQRPHGPIIKSSRMANADTHIEMSVKFVFDKTNPQDAFYSDKFTLSATNIALGATKAIKNSVTGNSYSVQYEVEALTAVVRDSKKRLCKFVWGDMVYEGLINSVNAEYQMFNVNGEPCRAVVNMSIVLYDVKDMGADVKIWEREYQKDFGGEKSTLASAASKNVVM